jgi:hypothetical protein
VSVMGRLRPALPKALSPRALGLTAWALGKMGLKLRPDFATALLDGFKAQLHCAGPRELALLSHGLAGCGCRPEGQWVGVFLHRVEGQLPGFSPADLAMLLGALVKLRWVCCVQRGFRFVGWLPCC